MPAIAAAIYTGLTAAGGFSAVTGSMLFAAVVETLMVASSYMAYQSAKRDRMKDIGSGTIVNARSSEEPIPVLYGRHRVGGNQIDLRATGDNNEYLHIVMSLSEGPIHAIEQVYLDDKPISEYGNLAYYEFFNGSGNQDLCPDRFQFLWIFFERCVSLPPVPAPLSS